MCVCVRLCMLALCLPLSPRSHFLSLTCQRVTAQVLCTISVSCSLAVSAGHVPPWPQISMCGMYPPERYVFSLGFSIGSMLLGILLVINHLRASQLDPARTPWHGEVHLGVGLASALCLALMATVPVSEYPVPHVMFAVFFFVLVLIFQAINTATRLRNLGAAFSAHVAAKEGWMVLWMLACAVAFVTWQATGSTLSQYLAVAAVMLHFSPYVFELQDSHLHLQVRLYVHASGAYTDACLCVRMHAIARGTFLCLCLCLWLCLSRSVGFPSVCVSLFVCVCVSVCLSLILSHSRVRTRALSLPVNTCIEIGRFNMAGGRVRSRRQRRGRKHYSAPSA